MKILLVCNAGMSTGIMKMKLEQEAKARGLEASVDAIPMVELGDNLKETGRRDSCNGNCSSGLWNDECKESS